VGAEIGVPFLANDGGAKAYFHSLGEALHYEFKPRGVYVIVVPPPLTNTFTAKMLGKALAKPQARGPRPNNGRVMNRGCRKSLEVWKYVVDNGQLRNWPNEPALYYKNLGAYGARTRCWYYVVESGPTRCNRLLMLIGPVEPNTRTPKQMSNASSCDVGNNDYCDQPRDEQESVLCLRRG
jgi:hypothetical protein